MESNLILTVPLPEFVSTLEKIIRKVLSEKVIEDDILLTSEDVMKMFNISTTTLQHWRDKNKIPYSKVGKKIFYSRKKLLLMCNTQTQAA